MGLFNFVTDLLSGGGYGAAKDVRKGLEKAGTTESDFLNYLKQQFGPYMQAGQQALGEYYPAIEEMRNPQEFYAQMMEGYEQSPAAQMAIEEGTRAATQGAAASGGLGGGQLLKDLQGYGQKLSAADQQQWLNNMMGIRSGYTGGLQNLMTGGQQALSTFAPTGTALTGDLASILGQTGIAQGQQNIAGYKPYMDWLSKGMSMVGGAASGAGGLMGLMG